MVDVSCSGCHDSPPATASHLKHFSGTLAQAAYGDIRIAQDFTTNATGYIMGCGNCHPMDPTKHGNGVVDVELYNPLAAVGSLKALNPYFAEYSPGGTVLTDSRGLHYTNGKCSSVYCHSYNESTTTEPIPDSDPDWQTKTVTTRVYKAVTWGGTLDCSGCHGNPTQTSYLTNDGGAGDSHSWMDQYGYQNLHTYNMGYAPVSCKNCHNDTVKQSNTYTEDGMGVRTLSNVPISNFSKHVNGIKDVSFDKQNPFVYKTSMSLTNATYDQGTNTCSNVSCHIKQTPVKWGTPYRWYYNECDVCHGYSK
jgi:predicted CxxxxCH...CXXCH cytochrome family protein